MSFFPFDESASHIRESLRPALITACSVLRSVLSVSICFSMVFVIVSNLGVSANKSLTRNCVMINGIFDLICFVLLKSIFPYATMDSAGCGGDPGARLRKTTPSCPSSVNMNETWQSVPA